MEVYRFAEMFIEIDGEDEFDYTRFILRGQNGDFYYADTKDRFFTSSEIDMDNLDKISIDTDICWPRYSDRLLRAPSPVPQDSYVKEADFIYYNNDPEARPLRDLVSLEIEAYEILRQHPHPNIVEYRGCVVSNGRISGICLAKYKRHSMRDAPLNKDLFLEGIERGIRHLHSLGVIHNDIKPQNIMLDELDRPVIIDFDSWGRQEQELEMKKGTPEWSINGSKYEYALCENDMFALSKLREFISREPLAESIINISERFPGILVRNHVDRQSPGRVQCVYHNSGVTRRGRITGYHHPATVPPAEEKEKQRKCWGPELGQDTTYKKRMRSRRVGRAAGDTAEETVHAYVVLCIIRRFGILP
ncbi:hypothetical protein E4U15_006739 [Claviceps sp. LM218 group G6]|nr:hypothetical protein E4U15_006739 [Claviceps sp. LM218 group G6]